MHNLAGALQLAQRWKVDVLAVDKAGRWQTSAGFPLRYV